jgi:hypothetical protein
MHLKLQLLQEGIRLIIIPLILPMEKYSINHTTTLLDQTTKDATRIAFLDYKINFFKANQQLVVDLL